MSFRLDSVLRVGCVVTVLVLAAPGATRAQDAVGVAAIEDAAAPPGDSRSGTGFFGRNPERNRVIPSILRAHPFDGTFPELQYTPGLALQASGWLGAVFMNSYDALSLLAGVERAWLAGRTGSLAMGLGYRAGLVTGYDERFLAIAKDTPVLPFAGVLAWVQIGPVSLDGFYVYRAITLEGSVAF